MSPANNVDADFAFKTDPPITTPAVLPGGAAPPDPPGLPAPLDALVGTWSGPGFNAIWRPHFPAAPQDRFLELNATAETLTFSAINGAIPNRGLLQPDINMFGVTYHQQISDTEQPPNGLHNEPGIWAVVPQTTDPLEGPTVVRMASIPHGTTILAQGTVLTVQGPPIIHDNDIIPFGLNGGHPVKSDFATAEGIFPELNLSTATQFRSMSPSVTQQMVENPNSVLQAVLGAHHISSTTALIVATDDNPVPGGGTSNTAFLQGGAAGASQANAIASVVTAIFWIETIAGNGHGNGHGNGNDGHLQLQYTQTVMLDFNGLRWPHVTVATLTKQ